MFNATFENKDYKKEWLEYVPLRYENGKPVPSKALYRMGTVHRSDRETKFAVYDGATNFRGYVLTDGSFELNGSEDANGYKTGFLKWAKVKIEEDYQKLG